MEKNQLDETIINGSRVFIEDGKVNTEPSEEIRRTGYMSLDDCFDIVIEEVKRIYELNGKFKG